MLCSRVTLSASTGHGFSSEPCWSYPNLSSPLPRQNIRVTSLSSSGWRLWLSRLPNNMFFKKCLRVKGEGGGGGVGNTCKIHGEIVNRKRNKEKRKKSDKIRADVVLLHIIHYISEHIHKKQQPYRHCNSSLHWCMNFKAHISLCKMTETTVQVRNYLLPLTVFFPSLCAPMHNSSHFAMTLEGLSWPCGVGLAQISGMLLWNSNDIMEPSSDQPKL